MQFIRYDFSETIDLTLFKKQFLHFIVNSPELEIDIYTKYFAIRIILTVETKIENYFNIFTYKLERDNVNNYITKSFQFSSSEDKDINGIKDIIDLFDRSEDSVNLILHNMKTICERVCTLILIFNKLDKLKAWI